MVNMNFRTHQPFVGKSAFAHKGGMHVSAIARTTASYEHIDPQRVEDACRAPGGGWDDRTLVIGTLFGKFPEVRVGDLGVPRRQ